MGNRAVITTEYNYANDGIGVYLHWNGGRDSVHAFLEYMKLKRHRPPDEDCYGWARLCQVIGNFLGGTSSIGIDRVSRLDTRNGDNGTYIIQGWDIRRRCDFRGEEQKNYTLKDMLLSIDECQPVREQLGQRFLLAKETPTENLRIGDKVFVQDLQGRYEEFAVVGFGLNRVVNGSRVFGVPYVRKYINSDCDSEYNINNYLREKSYRVVQ